METILVDIPYAAAGDQHLPNPGIHPPLPLLPAGIKARQPQVID
jgi:hypothetical protein